MPTKQHHPTPPPKTYNIKIKLPFVLAPERGSLWDDLHELYCVRCIFNIDNLISTKSQWSFKSTSCERECKNVKNVKPNSFSLWLEYIYVEYLLGLG